MSGDRGSVGWDTSPPRELAEVFALVPKEPRGARSDPGKVGKRSPALPKLLSTTGGDKDPWSRCWDSHHQPGAGSLPLRSQ